MAELRAFVEIDAMQPQWAAYAAQTSQGDPATSTALPSALRAAVGSPVFTK